MEQPKSIKFAIYIYFIAVAISLLGAIPNYLAADPRPPFLSVILNWLAIYGLLVGLGYAIKIGKNWARHTNAVVTLLSLATVLFFGPSPSLSIEISQLILLINNSASILVVVLLYTSTANEWFRAVKT
ncbi:hypothetical protein ACFSJY_02555 [Thalassotalea euphylliae]|uniref:hypothetical protein n=1 Tax=Thalassotalea euphylliae TaxID=1655234 RepID=UPI00363F7648